MVTIFEKNTIQFRGLGLGALLPSSCLVTEELNGGFELVMEHPYDPYGKWARIRNDNILYASTPRGMEPFRIYRVKPTLEGVTVHARHIFYDLQDNLSAQVDHTGSAATAMNHLVDSLAYAMPFSFATDITKTGTMFGEYINPIQALLSEDDAVDSFVKVYGGELLRSGFSVSMLESIGADRGVSIRYGKNLIGLEVDEDISEVKTRIIVQNDAGTVHIKDSPYIGEYLYPKIHIIGAGDAAINEMERMAEAVLEEGIDLPNINIRVDFQMLSKTEEYKDYAVLEEVQLGDTVRVIHEKMNFHQKRKVISYEWDCLLERYNKVELGNFLSSLATTTNRLQQMVKSQQGKMTEIEVTVEGITTRVSDAEGNISELEQTAEGIQTEVKNAKGDISLIQQRADALAVRVTSTEGDIATLEVTADHILTRVESAEGDISSLEQTAKSITSRVEDAEDNISSVEQTAEKIDWIVESGTSAGRMTLTDEFLEIVGEEVVIDANMLLYGEMTVWRTDGFDRVGGYIGYATGDDQINAATEGIAMSAKDGDHYVIATTSGVRMTAGDEAVVVTDSGITTTDGVHTGSDRRIKNTISYDMEKYEAFFRRLQPGFYKMNKSRSDRFHIGFIAQDVETAIRDSGMTTQDFAGLVQHKPSDEQIGEFSDQYYLRYDEFIALNTHMIQKLMKRVEELEKKLGGVSSED